MEDFSPDKLLSSFISGDKLRTPYENELEKEYVVGMAQISRNGKDHIQKYKTNIIGLVKKTKEIEQYQQSLMEDLAKACAQDIAKSIAEYKDNPNIFDSPVETEFEFCKGENNYKVHR